MTKAVTSVFCNLMVVFTFAMVTSGLAISVNAQSVTYQGDQPNDPCGQFDCAKNLGDFGLPGDQIQAGLVEIQGDADEDVFLVTSPYSVATISRWFNDDGDNEGGSEPVATNLFLNSEHDKYFTKWGVLGDKRPLISTLLFPGQEVGVGVGNSRSAFNADSSGILSADGWEAPLSYELTALETRLIHPDRILFLDGQILRLDDPGIQTITRQTELISFARKNDPTSSVDAGEQLVTIVGVGPSLEGCLFRAYGNVQNSLALMSGDGSVIESAKLNVFWNDPYSEGIYPSPASNQNGREAGAMLMNPVPANEGLFLGIGRLVGNDGSVREPGADMMSVGAIQSASPVRDEPGYVRVICPDFKPAATPVEVGQKQIKVSWAGSTQCWGTNISFNHGQSFDIRFGGIGTEDQWWSQSRDFENGEEPFSVTLDLDEADWLPEGDLSWTLTPLCADQHWDKEPQPQWVVTGQQFVVDNENTPETDSFELSPPAPNPVRAGTVVSFDLTVDQPQSVQVSVYDQLGREILTVMDGYTANQANIQVSTSGLAAGMYVTRAMGENGQVAVQRFTVIR